MNSTLRAYDDSACLPAFEFMFLGLGRRGKLCLGSREQLLAGSRGVRGRSLGAHCFSRHPYRCSSHPHRPSPQPHRCSRCFHHPTGHRPLLPWACSPEPTPATRHNTDCSARTVPPLLRRAEAGGEPASGSRRVCEGTTLLHAPCSLRAPSAGFTREAAVIPFLSRGSAAASAMGPPPTEMLPLHPLLQPPGPSAFHSMRHSSALGSISSPSPSSGPLAPGFS